MIWSLIRKVLFFFDAETIHTLGVRLIVMLGKICPPALRFLAGVSSEATVQPVEVLGMRFRNPIGLAAGFDKNAELVPHLPDLGFGYVEIGTVTPRPQGGNPRPRLFRDAKKEALFNRMGFNGLGSAVVASRLREIRPQLPEDFRVGVNLGKNKDTPLEMAAADYAAAAVPFEGLADYLVINVSSPNTPGLRLLQTEASLREIVAAVTRIVKTWAQPCPILVKLAPEVGVDELQNWVPILESEGVAGWIVSNTLAGRWDDGIPGGWSGLPVQEAARRSLDAIRSVSRLPIISVGGILSRSEAALRFASGAALVQVYAGWVLRGPRLIGELLRS